MTGFEQELQNMDHRLTEMEEKIDSINTKLTQVVDAILGNPLTKTGGFIADISLMKERLDALEKKYSSQEDFKKRIYWTVGIITGILILIQYITSIYNTLNK